eukprot:9233558-Lingulodinium_polyedra.AAC.1
MAARPARRRGAGPLGLEAGDHAPGRYLQWPGRGGLRNAAVQHRLTLPPPPPAGPGGPPAS